MQSIDINNLYAGNALKVAIEVIDSKDMYTLYAYMLYTFKATSQLKSTYR
ncbi:hypothetical protein DSUL_260029 [Desulfovibrionales bacterium]